MNRDRQGATPDRPEIVAPGRHSSASTPVVETKPSAGTVAFSRFCNDNFWLAGGRCGGIRVSLGDA